MNEPTVRTTLVFDPEGNIVDFAFPDGETYTMETSLWGLTMLYARLECEKPGIVNIHSGFLRVTEEAVADPHLDLTIWRNPTGEDLQVYSEGPTLVGSRDELLSFLEIPIRTIVETLADHGTTLDDLRQQYAEDIRPELQGTRLWDQLSV